MEVGMDQRPKAVICNSDGGAPTRIRTSDPLIKSQLLCQLSYGRAVCTG